MSTALPPIEAPYLLMERPVIVYQRHGGLIAVPFDIDSAPHVVAVRIDPLTDAETVALIPACLHDSRATLAALVEALDALQDVRDHAQATGHDEAYRLCQRALAAVRREGQALAETRAQPTPRVVPYRGRRAQRDASGMRAWA